MRCGWEEKTVGNESFLPCICAGVTRWVPMCPFVLEWKKSSTIKKTKKRSVMDCSLREGGTVAGNESFFMNMQRCHWMNMTESLACGTGNLKELKHRRANHDGMWHKNGREGMDASLFSTNMRRSHWINTIHFIIITGRQRERLMKERCAGREKKQLGKVFTSVKRWEGKVKKTYRKSHKKSGR